MRDLTDTPRPRMPAREEPARPRGRTDTALIPLIRLRQIAEELRGAAQRNDVEVIRAAVGLLGPTVEQYRTVREPLSDGAGEAAEAADQIQCILAECEAILTTSMRGLMADMRRIRQGKRSLAVARGGAARRSGSNPPSSYRAVNDPA